MTEAATHVIANTDPCGALGWRVSDRLAELRVPQRGLVDGSGGLRDIPGVELVRVRGYDDREPMRQALQGVETLFLVPLKESPDRARLHRMVVDAAREAGVLRIVYSSFLGAARDATFTLARDHYATEQYIRSTGMAFTFLRGSAFFESLRWIFGSDGAIRGPAGTGRFTPIARDDLADVIAAVLASNGAHDGQTYDVTGPQRLSMADIADEFSRASGQRLFFVEQTLEEAWASRRSLGAPDWLLEAWVTTYLQIARGELDILSDSVVRLTGHTAMSLRDHLATHPDTYPHVMATTSAACTKTGD